LFEFTGNPNNPGNNPLNPDRDVKTSHDGTVIQTFPGWKVTVSTDIDGDGNFTEVLTTNINGTTKATPLDDGNTLFTYDGPALNFDAGEWKLLTGHFTWTGDADFNTVQPLSGHGQVIPLIDFLL
jgi:hypothetical protein